MPTTSTRLTLFTALKERLALILKVNGYNTDAGALILFGELPALGEDDPPEALAIVVGDDAVSDQGDDIPTPLPLAIVGSARAGLNDPAPWLVVEAIIADIKRAIEDRDRAFGGLLTKNLERGVTHLMERGPGETFVAASVGYVATYLDTWGADA